MKSVDIVERVERAERAQRAVADAPYHKERHASHFSQNSTRTANTEYTLWKDLELEGNL